MRFIVKNHLHIYFCLPVVVNVHSVLTIFFRSVFIHNYLLPLSLLVLFSPFNTFHKSFISSIHKVIRIYFNKLDWSDFALTFTKTYWTLNLSEFHVFSLNQYTEWKNECHFIHLFSAKDSFNLTSPANNFALEWGAAFPPVATNPSNRSFQNVRKSVSNIRPPNCRPSSTSFAASSNRRPQHRQRYRRSLHRKSVSRILLPRHSRFRLHFRFRFRLRNWLWRMRMRVGWRMMSSESENRFPRFYVEASPVQLEGLAARESENN